KFPLYHIYEYEIALLYRFSHGIKSFLFEIRTYFILKEDLRTVMVMLACVQEIKQISSELRSFWRELPRIRVEDDSGLALMEPICLHHRTFGLFAPMPSWFSFPLCCQMVDKEQIMPIVSFPST
ncbi:hypothetical protein Pfo_012996, partial [Paulownia fortunei]